MKTFVSANELCGNLAIGVTNGPALKIFLDSMGVEKRKRGNGEVYCREAALPYGQEFIKQLKANAKAPERVAVKRPRTRKATSKANGMLLVLPVGENETVTVDMKRAEEIYFQLDRLFGKPSAMLTRDK